jgi:hypothetical protein
VRPVFAELISAFFWRYNFSSETHRSARAFQVRRRHDLVTDDAGRLLVIATTHGGLQSGALAPMRLDDVARHGEPRLTESRLWA